MFGGAEVMRDVGMEKLLRDATIVVHSDGTNTVMRLKVASSWPPRSAQAGNAPRPRSANSAAGTPVAVRRQRIVVRDVVDLRRYLGPVAQPWPGGMRRPLPG